jgi:hypothetical protein
VGIWDSFFQRRREFVQANDQERLRMTDLHDEGFRCQETNPEESVALFTLGRQLAERLGEPWWVFFYDVWRTLAMTSYVEDYTRGLDLAVACVLQARKPQFADHAWRVAAFNTVLGCYLEIDPQGYAAEIQQTLDYLDTIIPPGPQDDRLVMLGRKRSFLAGLERWDEARAVALEQLALCDADTDHDDDWYGLSPVSFLCWLAGRQEDWAAMAQYADLLEEWALPIHAAQEERCEAELWQAILSRRAGDDRAARRSQRSAVARMARLGIPCDAFYLDALAQFHELGGNLANALRVRDKELAQFQGKGAHFRECEAHLKRCKLLARMARLRDSDLEAAHTAVKKLRRPQKYLTALDTLRSDAT